MSVTTKVGFFWQSIKQRLELHTAKRDVELSKQTPTKLSKKEKKKQKESKKLFKQKKMDADKVRKLIEKRKMSKFIRCVYMMQNEELLRATSGWKMIFWLERFRFIGH